MRFDNVESWRHYPQYCGESHRVYKEGGYLWRQLQDIGGEERRDDDDVREWGRTRLVECRLGGQQVEKTLGVAIISLRLRNKEKEKQMR